MKKDVEILVNSKTSQVILNKKRLGINYENLQGKIIVRFDDEFVDGIAYLEIERNGETGYLLMAKENETYTLEIKSSLLNVVGQINMQVRITEQENGNEIPIWKSNIFYLNVEKAINSTTEIPDEYPEWIDTANAKLQEIDNLNIEAEKVDYTTTITITGKDGTETSVEINDGSPGPAGEPGPIGPVGPAGQNGRDGAIQYTAGDNITIENNVISADLTSKQDIIQYAILPTASADYLGKIFQYTGATDTYINGHFYICVNDNNTYSWEEIQYGSDISRMESIPILNLDQSIMSGLKSINAGITSAYNKNILLAFINEMVSKGKTVSYFTNRLEDYFTIYRIIIPSQTTGTQTARIYMEPNFSKATELKYGEQYWVSKTLKITYTDNIATDISIPLGGSSVNEWKYLKYGNTNSFTPVNNYDPSTKKYVDDNIANVQIQYSTMPTAQSTNVGKIVQYTGTTDSTYTNGYFYVCMTDGTTYSWQEVPLDSGKGLPIRHMISSGNNFGLLGPTGTINSNDVQALLDIMNGVYSAGLKSFILVVEESLYGETTIIYSCRLSTSPAKIYMSCIGGNPGINIREMGSGGTHFNISGSFDSTTNSYTRLDNYVGSWGGNAFILYTNNTSAYTPTSQYNPSTKGYVDSLALIESVINSDTTYTIANLTGNKSYKLGEITSLTITSSTASDYESVIYFESGSTATSISIPDTITNLGDVPTLTTASNVSTGTCTANKNYIIAILNNIAVWKEY